MSDKRDVPAAGFAALPDHRVVALEGRDALAFAQAQTMNDVAALADGHWHWNGWLTPKGRVIALFALLRMDSETAWCVLPDADPDELATALRRFVFRSKVVVSVRDALQVSGAFGAPGVAAGARVHAAGDAVELDLGGDGGARTLRITPGNDAVLDPGAALRWRAFDLRHGLPRLSAQQAAQWTPQQLSLQRLRAFSVKKGCYPGQEIVARTHFLGQAKRGLALLETGTAAAEGDAVTLDDAALGTVVAAVSCPALALAVVPVEHAAGTLRVGAQGATEVALRDGLAR